MPKTEAQIGKILSKHKTTCCKSTWERKGRAHYTCNNCGKDITLELVFLRDALTD